MTEKTPLLHKFVQMPKKSLRPEVDLYLSEKLFLKNYDSSEGAVSHNVLYYQQLSIALFTK